MDRQTMEKLAGEDLGKGIVQSPQDVCFIPSQNLIAVADDFNGLVVLDSNGRLAHHFSEIKDCGSVCYNKTTNQLAVTAFLANPDAKESPYQLWHISLDDWSVEMKKFNLPQKPQIKSGYIRWICVDQLTGNYFIATGDNEKAVVLKFNVSTRTWLTLLERGGDLEHPSIVNKGDGSYDIILAAYTEERNWHIAKLTFDPNDNFVTEEVLVKAEPEKIQEPWAVTVINDSVIVAYDYKAGSIWRVGKVNDQWVISGMVGAVQLGQWVSLEVGSQHIYVSCSEEKIVRRFSA
uniref:Uncharacterized protein n=1 Tax=Plectus sambesii TaxID=2011161 RepID=A0A914V2J8_9BILA